jgi:GAF domain-containing protein/rhodanese-related sulfurtransferase
MAGKDEVRAAIGEGAVCMINALPEDQHRFTSGIHYGRPGHIKGSVNLPSGDLLDPETNEFLPAGELRRRFDQIGAFSKRVITYCGGGAAASADAMALVMLGHPDVKLYDGSLLEWSTDPSLPMEVDPVPVSSNQAVIAIENRRLFDELREALAQQAAMSEILQIINSSPGNLEPVFDAVIENSMRLCEATQGHLYIYADGQIQAEALRGEPRFIEWLRGRGSHTVTPGSPTERALHGEQVIHIADPTQIDTYRNSPMFKELIDRSGIRTGVTVALRKDDAFLGTINVYRQEVRPFTDKQIALLQDFAAQAVIAMDNARLLTETRDALEQQTATAEVLQVINSSPGNLAPVFDAMLDKALRLCGAAYGALRMWDGEHLTRVAWRAPQGFEDVSPKAVTATPGSLAERFVRGETVISISDLVDDGNYQQSVGAQSLVRRGNARTFLGVALRKDDQLLGTLVIYRQEVRAFTEKQIALLQNFAAQAVIAMENARLLTETREALEQQTATAEVLQVINSSPGELTPVFDAILEKAHSLCDIAQGSLELYDGEWFRAVAVRGLSDEFAEILRQGCPAADNPATRPLLGGSRFAHILDLAETDYTVTRSAAELDAVHTLLCVPLRRDRRLLGMIASARREVRPFSDKEIALLANFAAQAVIAMDNARLLNEIRRRQAELRVTFDNMGDGVAMFDGEQRWQHGTAISRSCSIYRMIFSPDARAFPTISIILPRTANTARPISKRNSAASSKTPSGKRVSSARGPTGGSSRCAAMPYRAAALCSFTPTSPSASAPRKRSIGRGMPPRERSVSCRRHRPACCTRRRWRHWANSLPGLLTRSRTRSIS